MSEEIEEIEGGERSPAFAEINLSGFKIALGSDLPDSFFKFEVIDVSDGSMVVSTVNTGDGEIIFPTFILTASGVHNYIIREVQLIGGNWITDPTEYRVEVILTPNPSAPHGFDVEIRYLDGDVVFTNRFVGASCPAIGRQQVDVCVPVSVKPFANIGIIKTLCCGEAIISPGTNICGGIPNGECKFTISQKICVEVPVDFGAETTTGETHVLCEAVSTSDICKNCDQQVEQ